MRMSIECLDVELDDLDFIKLAKAAKHPREKLRFLGFVHLKEGKSIKEVGDILKVNRNTIYQWLRAFKKEGVQGLLEKGGRGRKLLILETKREAFIKSVLQLQEQNKGTAIRAQNILQMMQEKFGVKCTVRSVYNHLKKAGLDVSGSRSRHCKSKKKS